MELSCEGFSANEESELLHAFVDECWRLLPELRTRKATLAEAALMETIVTIERRLAEFEFEPEPG